MEIWNLQQILDVKQAATSCRCPQTPLFKSSSSCSMSLSYISCVYTQYSSVILFSSVAQGHLGISFYLQLMQYIAVTKFTDLAFVWENDLNFQ